jgi:GNAT superfamily N-acetyltransferase
MEGPLDNPVPPAVIRRCLDQDWKDIRRLHVRMALGIPLAVDVELNDVFAIPDNFWLDYARTCARSDEQVLLVAGVGRDCVGMGHVQLVHGHARLSMLFVDEDNRGRGIGASLLAAQESWARDWAASDLVCHIPDTSAAARLVEHRGWRRTDEIFVAKNRLVERRWVKAVT